MKKYVPTLGLLLLFGCSNSSYDSNGDTTDVPDGSLGEQLAFISDDGNYTSEGERLSDLFDVYLKWQYESSPITATFMGNSDYNDSWGDFSPDGTARNLEEYKQFYDLRESFNPEWLNREERGNLAIFSRSVESFYNLNGNYPEQYTLIDQVGGAHLFFPTIFQMMPKSSKKDFDNLSARLEKLPTVIEQMQATLKEAVEKDIMMPRTTQTQVPAQLRSLISEDPESSVFYTVFAQIPEGAGIENPEQFQQEVKEMITNGVNPALANFLQFMEEEYIPKSRETYGLSELPNGEEWYNERIRYYTTTQKTAKEIHELGKSEVARIREEMLAIKDKVDFDGDLDAFNEFLRTDPQFYFDTPEELLREYRDICKRLDAKLVSLFGRLPRLPYGVKAVPAYSEQSTTTAYYNPGSFENGTPGYFFANTYNLKSRPKWEMEALSIHEAVPGHHLQIAIAQELENVPEFRTTLTFTAFIEGWGLYSESLGPELGMYTDPYAKYGQLTYEMWRAIRLVVDTGIHAFGWSRDEAIAYFKANSGKSEHDIAVEIDRYIAWPGQALAYKIGELKIKELKQRSKDALGDGFDIREFHDIVLGSGAIPLDVLEANIDRWILEKQQGTSS